MPIYIAMVGVYGRCVTYIRVGGADIYHEISGSGDEVLLLHGGFCTLESMRPQMDSLANDFTVHASERPGHGRSADIEGPLSYADSFAHVVNYMDEVGLTTPHVIGFSDGAIIGLMLALRYPDRCRSLVAISGNLDPSAFEKDDAPVWVDRADDDAPDRHRLQYEALSPDGPEHANIMVDKLFRLWTTEPSIDPAALIDITCPVLVMAGDRDVVKLDHSALIASSIRLGQLCIVPGAGHDLVDTRPAFVTQVIRDFLGVSG